jgi:hypothetical protein
VQVKADDPRAPRATDLAAYARGTVYPRRVTMQTTPTLVTDLKVGDRIVEQGAVVTVVSPVLVERGIALLDLDAPNNTFHYDPAERVAKVVTS